MDPELPSHPNLPLVPAHSLVPREITAGPLLPRTTFDVMLSGNFDFIRVPRDREWAVKPNITQAFTALLSKSGLANPTAWLDTLVACSRRADLYVMDRYAERYRVLDVIVDPGEETGYIVVRHLGRKSRAGTQSIDIHDAYGKMLPFIVYKDSNSFRNNPHPLDLITSISGLSKSLEGMASALRRITSTKSVSGSTQQAAINLLAAVLQLEIDTHQLVSTPNALVFGRYLQDWVTLFSYRDLISKIDDDALIAAWDRAIKILTYLVNSYISDHIQDRSLVSRKISVFLAKCDLIFEAVDRDPQIALAAPDIFGKLDCFRHALRHQEKTKSDAWSIPRWADLRRQCGIQESISYVSSMAAGVAGFDHSFAGKMIDILGEIDDQIDAFQGDSRSWVAVASLQGKSRDYYISSDLRL